MISGLSCENHSLGITFATLESMQCPITVQGNDSDLSLLRMPTDTPNQTDTADETLSLSICSVTSQGSNPISFDNFDSTASLLLLNRTPSVIDGISTPNLTLVNDKLVEEMDSLDTNAEINELNETKDILLNAGYTPSEVKDILSSNPNGVEHGDRNRPLTHIFHQGKAYTYGKLEIESLSLKKRLSQ